MYSIEDEKTVCKEFGIFYKEIYFDDEDGADIAIWREGADIFIKTFSGEANAVALEPYYISKIAFALKTAKRDAETVRALLNERSSE